MSDLLKRALTFGMYQDDNGLFKIGSSTFKYNDTHVYIDGTKCNSTRGLWELLTKSRPHDSIITQQDKKDMNTYWFGLTLIDIITVLQVGSKQTKASNIQFISPLFKDTSKLTWETLEKPGKDPALHSSYRPISLLDTIGKVF
jgi:hypothetical protein